MRKAIVTMTPARSILIVDGDPVMRATLREQLTRDGAFAVTAAAGAQEAMRCLMSQGESRGVSEGSASGRAVPDGFAAAIVDADLPDGGGAGLCAAFRADGWSMPVILLNGGGGHGVDGDTIVIAKPFRIGVLLDRLRGALDKPTADPAPPPLRIGPFAFHPDEKALRDDAANLRIRLTEKEAAILVFLHRTGGKAVSRLDLLREVWGYHPSVTTHTLETHVYRLRRKIEAHPGKARLLITEDGGYRLAAGVMP